MAYENRNRHYRDDRRSSANYRRRNYRRNDTPANGEGEEKKVRYPGLPPYVQNIEPHIVRMIRVLHSNADIRRYTALGIVNRMLKNNTITEDGNYVRFRWDKYTVCSKGINTDHRYTEKVFLESFAGAFNILATVASKSLDNFCRCEFEKSSGDTLDEKAVNEPSKEIIERQIDSDENIANFENE